MNNPRHVPLVSGAQPPTWSTFAWPRRLTHKQAIAFQMTKLCARSGEVANGRRAAGILLCRPVTRPHKGERRRLPTIAAWAKKNTSLITASPPCACFSPRSSPWVRTYSRKILEGAP